MTVDIVPTPTYLYDYYQSTRPSQLPNNVTSWWIVRIGSAGGATPTSNCASAIGTSSIATIGLLVVNINAPMKAQKIRRTFKLACR